MAKPLHRGSAKARGVRGETHGGAFSLASIEVTGLRSFARRGSCGRRSRGAAARVARGVSETPITAMRETQANRVFGERRKSGGKRTRGGVRGRRKRGFKGGTAYLDAHGA